MQHCIVKLAVFLNLLLYGGSVTSPEEDVLREAIANLVLPLIQESEARISAILKVYGRTTAWQQETMFDRIRMEGDSGIMQTRNDLDSTRSWQLNNWARRNGQAAIHDHANNIRTVGMGEFSAVLNGVAFTTRHNDYRLNMAHRTSSEDGAFEEVPFPEVPPSVLAKTTVAEQIAEMKEYFKAFAEQDSLHRDYKPFFKPVLTYMQGAWKVTDGLVEESFFSDRHSIQAETWERLQDDSRASFWSGKKDIGENLATLPTRIYDVDEDGIPKVAQWNYNIGTHPLSLDVSLNRFRLVDDLSVMMRSGKTLEEFAKTRNARFQLHHQASTSPFDGVWREEKDTGWENFLEELMTEVPGMDNYQANIADSSFGEPPLRTAAGNTVLNAGYYHRYYSMASTDASGLNRAARGFADSNLFVALNNQSAVVPIPLRKCEGGQPCEYENVKASYAIPLEIVFMTPLLKWNPYNIAVNMEDNDFPRKNADGQWTRHGRSNNSDTAYNGASQNLYYLTPAEFFEKRETDRDSADTTKDSVYILDQDGVVRRTVASGTRIILPDIHDVGSIRTRFPIFNVHQRGSAIYKELSALKDLVRIGAPYEHLYERPVGSETFTFALRSEAGASDPHAHTFKLTTNQILAMKEGVRSPGFLVQVETSTTASHSHTLQVRMKSGNKGVWIRTCDGMEGNRCPDEHPTQIDCLDCSLNLLDPL